MARTSRNTRGVGYYLNFLSPSPGLLESRVIHNFSEDVFSPYPTPDSPTPRLPEPGDGVSRGPTCLQLHIRLLIPPITAKSLFKIALASHLLSSYISNLYDFFAEHRLRLSYLPEGTWADHIACEWAVDIPTVMTVQCQEENSLYALPR